MSAAQVTVAEAADRLGITRQAVLKLVKSGTLPATAQTRSGRVVRYVIPASAVTERANAETRPEGWLTVAEAAERRGRQPDTIRNWIAECGLAAEQLPSGEYLIDRAVLDEFPTPRPGPRGNRPEAAS